MASRYYRGTRIWYRLKGLKAPGKWGAMPSPYRRGEEVLAERWATAAQKRIDERLAASAETEMSVRTYAEKWLAEREKRNLASFADDKGRLHNHVLPLIGHLPIAKVRVVHIRDMVRALERKPDLAPRTIHKIWSIAATMLRDAQREELLTGAPWDLPMHERPGLDDQDPEWRELATYTLDEVVMLCTDPRIPPVRRVQYSLKALAGLRHGEVAGLRWRNWIKDEPLWALSVARSYQKRRTKTEVTRRVPVVSALQAVLSAWHWQQNAAAGSLQDTLIVSTQAGQTISAHYAHEAFLDDLRTLGLRERAGEHRNRGGHDLRAWFITTCKSNGASAEDIARITHTKKKDVIAGYTRPMWAQLCAAAEKIGVVLDGDPLAVSDSARTPSETPSSAHTTSRPQRDSKVSVRRSRVNNDADAGERTRIEMTDHDVSRIGLSYGLGHGETRQRGGK